MYTISNIYVLLVFTLLHMCLSQPGDDTISMSLCSMRIDQHVLFINPNMYIFIVYISVIYVLRNIVYGEHLRKRWRAT